jgi:hypothetical protein
VDRREIRLDPAGLVSTADIQASSCEGMMASPFSDGWMNCVW